MRYSSSRYVSFLRILILTIVLLIDIFFGVSSHSWGYGIILTLISGFYFFISIREDSIYWPITGIINGLVFNILWLCFKSWEVPLAIFILFQFLYFLLSAILVKEGNEWRKFLGLAFLMIAVLNTFFGFLIIKGDIKEVHHPLRISFVMTWLVATMIFSSLGYFLLRKRPSKNNYHT